MIEFDEAMQARKDALGRDENGDLFTWRGILKSGLDREEELKIQREKNKA